MVRDVVSGRFLVHNRPKLAPCACIHVVDSAEREANNALDELGMVDFIGHGEGSARGMRAFTSRYMHTHVYRYYRTRCNLGVPSEPAAT